MNQNDDAFPNYTSVLTQKGGLFRFHISELGIVASGKDLESAHLALEEKKQKIFEEFRAAGLIAELTHPGTSTNIAEKTSQRNFVLRTLIVTVAAIAVVGATMFGARSVITSSINAVKIKPGEIHLKLFEDKLIATLKDVADLRNDYSAEKRDEVIESLRTIVKRYKPFVDEVRPLISGDTDTTPQQPIKGN